MHVPGRHGLNLGRYLRPQSRVAVLAMVVIFATAACDVTYLPPATGTPDLGAPIATTTPAQSLNPSTSPSPSPSSVPAASPRPSSALRPSAPPPAGAGSVAAFAPCPGRVTTAGSGPLAQDTSTNWSGYAATSDTPVLTCVEAIWTQPTIRCTSARTAISMWVGLGGFDQEGLEQIGSEVDCLHGHPNGFLWHESLPFERYEVPIRLAVERGDHLRVQVRLLGGATYQLSIANLTRGTVFTVRDVNTRIRPTSAEWIAEAPTGGCPLDCHVLPMPNFGHLIFSGTWLTVGGRREPLDGVDVSHVAIQMLSPDGSARADVLSTASSGTSFTVAWRRA